MGEALFFCSVPNIAQNKYYRLSINKPTKRGKENSPSEGHCQCEKEMDDLLACQQFLKESYEATHRANERALF
jgi:hypothetical protein